MRRACKYGALSTYHYQITDATHIAVPQEKPATLGPLLRDVTLC
jgi:hypothetical protein